MYKKKCCKKKVDLLLIEEEGKRHYVLIKDCNSFMYDHMIIHYIVEEKNFCRYCLQAFSTEEILKSHIKNWFKVNGKERIIIPKKTNMLNSEIMKAK